MLIGSWSDGADPMKKKHPGILFAKKPNKKMAKAVEAVSGIWIVGMYLSLGGIPMLMKIIG